MVKADTGDGCQNVADVVDGLAETLHAYQAVETLMSLEPAVGQAPAVPPKQMGALLGVLNARLRDDIARASQAVRRPATA